MKVRDLHPSALADMLRRESLLLKLGPFRVSVSSSLPIVHSGLSALYSDYCLASKDEFVDFHVALFPPSLLRTRIRPQVSFYLDGHSPFKPLPQNQAYAMFEWGLNWCIANHAHLYLNIHAAVVEKDGFAIILPGAPGSGKSTLCAALVHRGWRLLSDEMALVANADGRIIPVPRPVGLKNQSISVIRSLSGDLVISDPVEDTAKGSVAHMRPPRTSIEKGHVPAEPRLIVFPRFTKGVKARLSPLSKGRSLLAVAENSFNYNILGETGFRTLATLIDRSSCYQLCYEDMNDGMEQIDQVFHG